MRTADRPSARDRILDVADRLFYERGIHAVGVDAIVAEADTAKTTLYSHFRSKDELVAAYLRRRCERWREHLDTELEAHGGPASERILLMYELLGQWFAEPGYRGCPFINAMAEFHGDHPAAIVTRVHRQGLLENLARLSAEAGAPHPESLAAQLLLLYDAAMVAAYLDGDPGAAQTAKAAAAALLGASR
ncbi:MAG TPA: helix-turn-helix domain-containing protein [Kribbella sp.]|nr:helix-turn-helix domain-containing protein [Kribbella sp.]